MEGYRNGDIIFPTKDKYTIFFGQALTRTNTELSIVRPSL